MANRTLALVGLVELLVPRRLISVAERLNFTDRGDAERRSWLLSAARIEGLLWLLLARRASTTRLRPLLAVVGLPAVLAPKRTLDVGLRLADTNSETIEVAPWLPPVTRLVGLGYVVIGIRAWLRRDTESGGQTSRVRPQRRQRNVSVTPADSRANLTVGRVKSHVNHESTPEHVLAELLAGNDRHVAHVDEADFDEVRDGQHPPVVSVCCSDSRVSQEGMWDITTPGTLFTVANIGNRATTNVDGERVLDGGVAYPVTFTDTGVVVVVGHTSCGAVTAAYDVVQGTTDPGDLPPGVRADVEPLVDVVAGAPVDLDGDRAAVVDRLVEHNVREQVAAVAERTDAAVYGLVYDFHHRYGDADGRTYLVASSDGDPAEAVGEQHRERVRSLL